MVNIQSSRDCVMSSRIIGLVLLVIKQKNALSFLMGLNDTYATVRDQILLMDPIPSLSKVFSLLLQDEKQRGSTLSLQPWQSRTVDLLLKVLTKASLVGLSAHTVELCVMWLTSATRYMVIHLCISPRTRLSKVEVHLLLTMWLPLIIAMKRLSISLEQNTNNFLDCSILRITLVLKLHKSLPQMHLRLLP